MRLKVSVGTCSIISSETELTQMRLKYFSVSQVQEEDVAWPGLAHLDAGEVPGGGDDVSKQDINLPLKCRLEA